MNDRVADNEDPLVVFTEDTCDGDDVGRGDSGPEIDVSEHCQITKLEY